MAAPRPGGSVLVPVREGLRVIRWGAAWSHRLWLCPFLQAGTLGLISPDNPISVYSAPTGFSVGEQVASFVGKAQMRTSWSNIVGFSCFFVFGF